MKLAALGVVTVGIGIALEIPGLMGIGLWWVVVGLLVRLHGRRLQKQQAAVTAGDAPRSTPASRPAVAVDGRSFAIGTLLFLLLGAPSVAVGWATIGIDADDEAWRWLPITVGGLALVVGVVSGLLYVAGSAARAAAGGGGATVPATIRIRSVRETGTYINERPRLAFELLVEPDPGTGVAAYEVAKKATVPFTALGTLRVGDGFRATVAGPDAPSSMDIRWDEPVRATAGVASGVDGVGPSVESRLEELERLRRAAAITDEEYAAERQRILGSL